jgi:phospholipid/cholesterol/gamma-HCH transport system ATP-binding protein
VPNKIISEKIAPVLTVNNLSSCLGTKKILDDISFSVSKGEIFVIMGASGSGKTTLLRHLVGLGKTDVGEVTLLGNKLQSIGDAELFELRKRIGVAFQSGALINSMSVIENVELPLRQHTNLDSSTIQIMSRMKLDMVSLSGAEDLKPAQLSGGMLKRAGLARAVVMDPQVLFFDEPSAGLDPVTSAELDKLIIGLRNSLKMTVIVVTHELESAIKIADRIMVLADGGVVACGTVSEIQASTDSRVQSMLHRRVRERRAGDDKYLDHLTHHPN